MPVVSSTLARDRSALSTGAGLRSSHPRWRRASTAAGPPARSLPSIPRRSGSRSAISRPRATRRRRFTRNAGASTVVATAQPDASKGGVCHAGQSCSARSAAWFNASVMDRDRALPLMPGHTQRRDRRPLCHDRRASGTFIRSQVLSSMRRLVAGCTAAATGVAGKGPRAEPPRPRPDAEGLEGHPA